MRRKKALRVMEIHRNQTICSCVVLITSLLLFIMIGHSRYRRSGEKE